MVTKNQVKALEMLAEQRSMDEEITQGIRILCQSKGETKSEEITDLIEHIARHTRIDPEKVDDGVSIFKGVMRS